jgi:hypothetical protein
VRAVAAVVSKTLREGFGYLIYRISSKSVKKLAQNNKKYDLLVSKIPRFVNVVFFHLGDPPPSVFYVLTFWKTLSVPSSPVV